LAGSNPAQAAHSRLPRRESASEPSQQALFSHILPAPPRIHPKKEVCTVFSGTLPRLLYL